MVGASVASADVVTQQLTYTNDYCSCNPLSNADVPYFDPSLGILQDVKVELEDIGFGGQFTYWNEDGPALPLDIKFTPELDVALLEPGVQLSMAGTPMEISHLVQPQEFYTTSWNEPSPPTLTYDSSALGTTYGFILQSDLAPFWQIEHDSTYSAFSVTPPVQPGLGADQLLDNPDYSFVLQTTYIYTPFSAVPEPGYLPTLLGFAGLGLIFGYSRRLLR